MDIDVRDAGFFVVEALRLQTLAASFQPVFSSTFEECVADAPACVNQIYGKLGLPPRKASVLAARVSSSLKVVRNLDELRATLADIKAGNWTSARRAKHIANVARRGAKALGNWSRPREAHLKSNASRGVARVREKVSQPALPTQVRNVSFDEAVKAAQARLTGSVQVGQIACPAVASTRRLKQPAYPLFAQIHRNRMVRTTCGICMPMSTTICTVDAGVGMAFWP